MDFLKNSVVDAINCKPMEMKNAFLAYNERGRYK